MYLYNIQIMLNPASSGGKTGINRDIILNKLNKHYQGGMKLLSEAKAGDGLFNFDILLIHE
jgi:hypothetical protein